VDDNEAEPARPMRTNALGHWSTYANLLREGSDRSLSRGIQTYRHYRFIQAEGSSGMNVKHQKVEIGREARGGIDLKRLAKISCLGKIRFFRQVRPKFSLTRAQPCGPPSSLRHITLNLDMLSSGLRATCS
jgi:hypothetical protein